MSRQLLLCSYQLQQLLLYCCQLLYSYNNSLKVSNFFFWLKTKNQLKKSLILLKIFPYLLTIPSTKSHLVTYLALYKEDQATHKNTHTHHHYPFLSHSLILKLHHFAIHKHISISSSISLTKSLLRKQHNPWCNTKKTTPGVTISSCIYYI